MWRKIQIASAVFLGLVFWFFSMVLAGGGLYTVAGDGSNPIPIIKMNRLTGQVWIYTMTVTRDFEVVSSWIPAVERRPGEPSSK